MADYELCTMNYELFLTFLSLLHTLRDLFANGTALRNEKRAYYLFTLMLLRMFFTSLSVSA